MLLAILAVWFGYKKARDTGRNGFLWGAICGAVFIGIQLGFIIGAGIVIGIGIELWGWRETAFDDYQILISIVSWAASVIALLIIFKFLDRIPNDGISPALPPPPPTFDGR